MSTKHTPGPLESAAWASSAVQLQYEANLRAANSRDERFSPLHRAQMQREADDMYARSRAAIAKATGSAA